MNEKSPETIAYVPVALRNLREIEAPSARNREIFRLIVVDKRKQVEVAALYGLSPQRISQIKQQVEAWLAYTGGHEEPCDWFQRMCVVEYTHRERLEGLFENCLRGFDLARQKVVTTKTVKVDGKPVREEVVEKQPLVSPRWLDLARKVQESRMAFEERRGTIQPPEDAVESDAEKKVRWSESISQQVYLDRPPGAEEFVDARGLQRKLEVERAKLEAEREQFEREKAQWKESRASSAAAPPAVKTADGSSKGESPSDHPLRNGTGTQAGSTDLEVLIGDEPRVYRWRYATGEDLNGTRQRRERQDRMEEAARRGEMHYSHWHAPLEVKRNVYIVPEPYPAEWAEEQKFKAEWVRREAAAKAAGLKW